jgi:hypothetical protein
MSLHSFFLSDNMILNYDYDKMCRVTIIPTLLYLLLLININIVEPA